MPTDNSPTNIPTDKLFVYGIFLGATMRSYYEMHNAVYATVPGFLTVGNHIVQSRYEPGYPELSLTGLLVDLPINQWESLDRLEAGYERVLVKTDNGTEAFIYAERGTAEKLGQENQSTIVRHYTSERVM